MYINLHPVCTYIHVLAMHASCTHAQYMYFAVYMYYCKLLGLQCSLVGLERGAKMLINLSLSLLFDSRVFEYLHLHIFSLTSLGKDFVLTSL